MILAADETLAGRGFPEEQVKQGALLAEGQGTDRRVITAPGRPRVRSPRGGQASSVDAEASRRGRERDDHEAGSEVCQTEADALASLQEPWRPVAVLPPPQDPAVAYGGVDAQGHRQVHEPRPICRSTAGR